MVMITRRTTAEKKWDEGTMAHLSRPKIKELSLMLWFVSSAYWLTLENRLWRVRVEGPERDKPSFL